MADHTFTFKLKRRAIVAVTGLPYTFRQEMGKYIANWVKCPDLKFEVILRNVDDQHDVAFNTLCETAASLLETDHYHPNCVVINFPIPTLPQLHKLLSLQVYGDDEDDDWIDSSYCLRPHRLLIIECQRRNKFWWRQAVEHPDGGWFWNPRYRTRNTKPGKWEDVEKAILSHQHDHYFLTLPKISYPDVGVKKLVVDPFEDLRSRDFTDKQGLDRSSLFAEAIKYYLSCEDGEYEDLPVNLDYSVWRRQWLESQDSSSRSQRNWCGAGNCIIRFTNKLEETQAICNACDEKVTEGEGAYYCQFCSLCLHQLCALAQSPTALTSKRPTLPYSEVVYSYSLMRMHPFKRSTQSACYSCNKDGKSFSGDCDACVFRTHLKCQLLPTALKHSCDQPHFLSIRLSWASFDNTVYDCKACGLMGAHSSYSCNICNSEYHLQCVLDMPLHTNQIPHGGHTHTLNINFTCGEREHEYEWCGVCYADINPDTWVYTCQHCDFVAHLYCIFLGDLFEWYKETTQWTH